MRSNALLGRTGISSISTIFTLLVAAALFSAHPANAEDAYQLAGPWKLDSESTGAACTLDLDSARTGPGHRLRGLEACKASFSVLETVAAWEPRPDGGIAFVDAGGKIVVDYGISETDSLLSVAPQHVFQRLTAIERGVGPITVGSISSAIVR